MRIINFLLILLALYSIANLCVRMDKVEKNVSTFNRPAVHSLLMAPDYEGGIDAYMVTQMIPMPPPSEATGLIEYLPLFSKVNALEGMVEGHIDDLRVAIIEEEERYE